MLTIPRTVSFRYASRAESRRSSRGSMWENTNAETEKIVPRYTCQTAHLAAGLSSQVWPIQEVITLTSSNALVTKTAA